MKANMSNDRHPTSPVSRFADLQRQGFMKPRRAVRKPKAESPIVACVACQNWHREGKHTADAATRRANLAAETKRLSPKGLTPNHSAGYPVWASPAERQVIDFFRTVSSASAADALRAVPGAKRRDVDRLHAQRVLISAPSSGRANLMRLAEHKPNHSAVYYVWLIDYRNVPIDSEGPYGPMSLDRASAFARIGAKNGEHDRAVSEGLDPESESFEIVRRYRRGTGERTL